MEKIIFRGGDRTGMGLCKITGPHGPHVLGHYSTVRWGELVQFCRGASGTLPNGETLHIQVEEYIQGDAAWPTTCVLQVEQTKPAG